MTDACPIDGCTDNKFGVHPVCHFHWGAVTKNRKHRLERLFAQMGTGYAPALVAKYHELCERTVAQINVRVRDGNVISKCMSCEAEIVFVKTRAGKDMPVDAESCSPGDRRFRYGEHVTHFSTCPNAKGHKKK